MWPEAMNIIKGTPHKGLFLHAAFYRLDSTRTCCHANTQTCCHANTRTCCHANLRLYRLAHCCDFTLTVRCVCGCGCVSGCVGGCVGVGVVSQKHMAHMYVFEMEHSHTQALTVCCVCHLNTTPSVYIKCRWCSSKVDLTNLGVLPVLTP